MSIKTIISNQLVNYDISHVFDSRRLVRFHYDEAKSDTGSEVDFFYIIVIWKEVDLLEGCSTASS